MSDRITVTRRGGIAGVARTGSGTTDDLPAEQAAAARAALAADRVGRRRRPAHTPGRVYVRGHRRREPTASRSRSFAEHELPDDLRPLVKHLLA